MTLALVLALALGGGVGALARFIADAEVSERAGAGFPAGTLVVNVSGAFALGLLVGAGVDGDAARLAGTGLVGSYTTFSTWAFESQRLGEEGQLGAGALNFALSLALGLLAAWGGRALGGAW